MEKRENSSKIMADATTHPEFMTADAVFAHQTQQQHAHAHAQHYHSHQLHHHHHHHPHELGLADTLVAATHEHSASIAHHSMQSTMSSASQDSNASTLTAAAAAATVIEPSSSSLSTPHGSNKRKRVVLSIHDKQQVLQRLELGEQPVVIARDFGISRQQVSDIKKNKDRILSFCIDAKHLSCLRRKTLKATSEYHPGVEQELYRWLIRQRRLNRMVTSEAIATKTTDLFLQYSSAVASNDESSNAPPVTAASTMSFKTITNWLRQFKRAHGIKSLTPEELSKLPERFVPAMDMVRSNGSTGNSADHPTSASSPSSSSQQSNSAAGMLPTTAVDDVSAYINGMTATTTTSQGQPPEQSHQSFQSALAAATGFMTPATTTSKTPMQSMLEIIQDLHHQMTFFEREMTLKMDYLDARMEKMCFSVLPPHRFST